MCNSIILQTYDVNAILQSFVSNASSSFLAGELRVLVLKVLMVTLVRLNCLSILVDGCNESEVTTSSVTLFLSG